MSEKHIPAFKESISVSRLDKPFHEIPKLCEFSENKDFLVRKADLYLFEEGQYTTPTEVAQKLKELFEDLRSYGINAPVSFVVAEDENGAGSVFNLTERVSSIDNELTDEHKQLLTSGAHEIVSALVSYYADKFATHEEMLCDIPGWEQFKFGTTPSNTKPGWYLIDTDPFYSSKTESKLDAVEELMHMIGEAEQKYGLDLSPEREVVSGLIEQIHKDN